MTVPITPPGRVKRRPTFSLRQLVLFFGLIGIILCAVGLTLKLVVKAVVEQPLVAVAMAAELGVAGAALSSARRRRAAGRFADELADLTHRIVETHAAEQERARAVVAV